MDWCRHSRRWWLVLAAVLAAGVSPAATNITQQGMENVRVPLEVGPDGKIKSQLFATRAVIGAGRDIETVDAEVKFYNDDGTVDVSLKATDCRYNRELGTATSRNRVLIERKPDMVITGTGMEWNAKDGKMLLKKDVKVVITGGGLGRAIKAKAGEKRE